MTRRALVLVATLFLALAGAASADAATTQPTFLTFYGWWDNTPPGGDIAYPQIHDTAGGKGTYTDPITFATSSDELKPGTKVWVPRVKKYFIMEDGCDECSDDWNSEGPNGGPGLRHIDLWLGGQGGSAFDAIDCEDALTHYNPDNTPVMEPVVVDPPSNEPYDPTPIFDTSTGECYGGAQPNTTVGQYRNNSTGTCLAAPSSGTTLKVAACTGTAEQRFTFHGAFLVINDRCAGISGSSIVLQTCTGGPAQQWSINPDGTISDIQSSSKCFRASSTTLTAGSCSGTAARWTFTPAATSGLTVTPSSVSVAPGASATATVTSAEAATLSASGAPAGVTVSFSPASVPAGGTSTVTVAAAATAAPGSATITLTGGTKTASMSVTVTGGSEALLSQGKPATASSLESSSYPAGAAFDGNLTSTRWASKEGSNAEWLRVDLGAAKSVTHVKLSWEAAYGKAYSIQTSADGTTWTTIYTTTSGNGGTDDLTGLTGTGRYVRMNGVTRGTSYGYSLYEMQVYGPA
ncbi:Ricin-type beta-trefoil lectin domain-containing protein [Amycolatopsis tolypomycina]|uniref:Ricin-type beta-trefoil lectin domain-containing protein n=1 Tax=Amycolatopsis tolypomycina TaxID=208445 RepID=A0A1H4IDS2_9PSEU|nr:discoidin domain-containing protein [Amycolatopsis tolypomycina]SEB32191.1 Ricin-type beta-trefoil lectin domain-containing protein [Amycolatopsis tolypomycina]